MKKTLTFAAIIAVVFCPAGLPAVGYAQERPDEASVPEVRTVDPHEARQALQRMIHEADDDDIIEMYYGAREAIEKKRALEHRIKKNLRKLNEMRQRFEESDRERENPENAAFRLPNSQQPSLFTLVAQPHPWDNCDEAKESLAGCKSDLDEQCNLAMALSANVRDTAGIPLNSGGHTLARRIDGETRAETLGWPGAPGPGG